MLKRKRQTIVTGKLKSASGKKKATRPQNSGGLRQPDYDSYKNSNTNRVLADYFAELRTEDLINEKEVNLLSALRNAAARFSKQLKNGNNPDISNRASASSTDGAGIRPAYEVLYGQASGIYKTAINQLVTSNLRLVINVAKRFQRRGSPFEDLIQEGNIGLKRAAEKFDHHKGYKFSTYAGWWILQGVQRALYGSRIIKPPAYIMETLSEAYKALYTKGEPNTIENVLREVEHNPNKKQHRDKIAHYLHNEIGRPISSNTKVYSDTSKVTIEHQLIGDDYNPEKLFASNQRNEMLHEMLNILPDREKAILMMRFGIKQERTCTLDEVGREFDLTRERIRQLEKNALTKLREQGITPDKFYS